MRIISRSRLDEFSEKHPKAKNPLDHWHNIVKAAKWKEFQEVKRTFNTVDSAKVASGKIVVIFDIGGNKFRIISALHYNRKKCFVLRVLTHSEYSENKWKGE